MSLRRKMGLQIVAMVVGLLLVSGASMWGLNGLRQDYRLALEGYQELRQVYEVGAYLATAKTLLSSARPDRGRATEAVRAAAERFDLFERPSGPDVSPLPLDGHGGAEVAIRDGLARTLRQLAGQPNNGGGAVVDQDARAVGDVLAEIGDLASQIGSGIRASERAAQEKRRQTMLALAAVCAAAVAGGGVLGVLQYRGVMLPLRRLGAGVRTIAAGNFSQRLVADGNDEFAALAADFNGMAAELDGFYNQLEQKVAAKSRDLVRSERLASVGYLAAGVAHEINNPLGVIAGYAEFALERLNKPGGAPDAGELGEALRIICDEAFRCKGITARLLSLARPGDAERRPVQLGRVVEEVIAIIGGLKEYRDRRLVFAPATSPEEMTVMAIEAEMKQVVLNLVLNALEAVAPPAGEVRVELARNGGRVELAVVDNGRGMSPDTLDHAFEPFFTDKRGPRQHGTGLGLSITHAIVIDHGGAIRAQSDGPGTGSRFVVELPAAAPAGAAA